MINMVYSWRKQAVASADPWDGRTLEWSIPSPPPHYNFDEIPQVKYRDDFWFTKHPELVHEDEAETSKKAPATAPSGGADDGDHGHGGIHMPDMSYYPAILAAGMTLAVAGLLVAYWMIAVGAIIMMWGLMGWSFEPVNDPEPEGESH